MAIPFIHVPDGPPYEACCFCRAATTAWTDMKVRVPGQQVACCPFCASTFFPDDVPTKSAWIRKERLISDGVNKAFGRTPRLVRIEKEAKE